MSIYTLSCMILIYIYIYNNKNNNIIIIIMINNNNIYLLFREREREIETYPQVFLCDEAAHHSEDFPQKHRTMQGLLILYPPQTNITKKNRRRFNPIILSPENAGDV